jgi:hypothetical protein
MAIHYKTGGEGAISVFEQQDPDHYGESGRITTVKGARTGFLSPELDRLFLAVRHQGYKRLRFASLPVR